MSAKLFEGIFKANRFRVIEGKSLLERAQKSNECFEGETGMARRRMSDLITSICDLVNRISFIRSWSCGYKTFYHRAGMSELVP